MLPSRLMSPFWLAAWAGTVAIAWLLPNHYFPWTSFHMDVWMATAFAMAAAAVLLRTTQRYSVNALQWLAMGVLVVPAIQWAFGQIHFQGVAWVNFLYLLGLLIAMLTGSQWEAHSPGQPTHALFLAIVIASIASVGMQLHQWLGLDVLEIWIMPDNYGRPFANLGQPNQLATLHVLALLGLTWASLHKVLRSSVAVGASLFILFGLALTMSRTSWVGLAWVLVCAWAWRGIWPQRALPWVFTLLALWFVLNLVSVLELREAVLGNHVVVVDHLSRATAMRENRPAIWSMLMDAASLHPWLGWGWGQVQWANLAVAAEHSPKATYFAHAHNIALDLAIWMGIPLALTVMGFLGWWLWRQLRSVSEPTHAVQLMLVLVMVNHALLELPLHYAYFLLPLGLVVGALDGRAARTAWMALPRWIIAVAWLVAITLLVLLIRDYSRVEPEYQKLRFEWARIKTDPAQAPEVLLLDQFPAFVRAVRLEARPGMRAEELKLLYDVSMQFPSTAMLGKLARSQALNGEPQHAARTLRTLCKVVPSEQCVAMERVWRDDARHTPALQAVGWPAN